MSTVLQPSINDINSTTGALQVDTKLRGLLREMTDIGVALLYVYVCVVD